MTLRVGGYDVGRYADHSVLTTLRAEDGIDDTTWVVERVTQLPLGLSFPDQLALLQNDIERLDHLAVDAGGSGQSMPDQISAPNLRTLVPVVITGGTGQGKVVKGRVTVGKSTLVQGMLQQVYHRQLRVDPHAPGRDLLRREMATFRYLQDGQFRKAEAAAGSRDDCVLATALAAYLAMLVI